LPFFGGSADFVRSSWSRIEIVEPSMSGSHETSSTGSPDGGSTALTQRLLGPQTVSCRCASPIDKLEPRGSGWKICPKP
jgi:hypothetical protein